MEQDWFVINPESWFLSKPKTLEQKLEEIATLPIYKIEKQQLATISKELQQRIDYWLVDEADESVEKANYVGEIKTEEEAWKEALYNFINDFDKVDQDYEFIKICQEDEPEKWEREKKLILDYLNKL